MRTPGRSSTSSCSEGSSSLTGTSGRTATAPRVAAKIRAILSVEGSSRNWEERWRSSQVSASVSYLTTGRTGSHHLKLRGEYRHLVMEEEWHDGYAGGVLSVTDGGAPDSVYLFETPSKSVGGHALVRRLSRRLLATRRPAHAQHRCAIRSLPRVLSGAAASRGPGGRSGVGRHAIPCSNNVADWNVVSPRLGLSYSVTSDGRTVVKLTYGKSWFPPGTELIFGANPNSRTWFKTIRVAGRRTATGIGIRARRTPPRCRARAAAPSRNRSTRLRRWASCGKPPRGSSARSPRTPASRPD